MAYSQIFTDERLYLLCITDGVVEDVDSFILWASQLFAKAEETGHSKLLIDNRTFQLLLSPMDVVNFASYFEEVNGASLGYRLAVLSSPKNPEISRLMETSLINRSASYKRFSSQKEAVDWLER